MPHRDRAGKQLTTPFAAGPGALAPPVTAAPEPEALPIAQAAPGPAPTALPEPTPVPEAPEEDVSALVQQFFAQQPQEAPSALPGAQVSPDAEINQLVSEFFETQEKFGKEELSFKNRFRLGLAVNNVEVIGTLQRIGFDAKIDDEGDLVFRKPGKEKFSKVDPSTGLADLIGDVADLSRIGLELAGEIIGGLLGSLVSPIAGTITGAAAGAAAGITMADTMAEILDVQQDPFRNKFVERTAGAAFSALFNGAGIFIGKGLQQARRLKDLKSPGRPIATMNQIRQEFENIADVVGELDVQFGLKVQGVDGKRLDVPIRAIQVNDSSLNQLQKEVGALQETLIQETAFIDIFDEAIDLELKALGSKVGIKNITPPRKNFPLAIKRVEGFLRKSRTDANEVIEIFKKEGSTIKTGALERSNITDALDEVFDDLEILPDARNLTNKQIADQLIMDPKDPVVSEIRATLEEIFNANKVGGLEFLPVAKRIKRLGKLLEKNIDKSARKRVAVLQRGFRKDQVDLVEAQLKGTPQENAFRDAMKTRSDLFDLQDSFADMFEKGQDIIGEKLLQDVFKTKRFDKIVTLRTFLVDAGRLDLWEDSVGDFIESLVKGSIKEGKISKQALANNFSDIGTAVRGIIKKDSGVDLNNLIRFSDAAAKLDRTLLKEITPAQRLNISDKFISLTSPFRNAQIKGVRGIVQTIINTMKGKGVLREVLSTDGLQRALEQAEKTKDMGLKRHLFRLANVFKLMGDVVADDVIRAPALAATRVGITEAIREVGQ